MTKPIKVTEYADYQCGFCAEAFPIVQKVKARLGDRIKFTFKNFPLTDIHSRAEQAAEAVEAAREQGKFEEMQKMVFSHQPELSRASLLASAKELGLDLEKFEKDLDDQRLKARVHKDVVEGEQDGVDSTPTFFINGVKYEGPTEVDALIEGIEELGQSSRKSA